MTDLDFGRISNISLEKISLGGVERSPSFDEVPSPLSNQHSNLSSSHGLISQIEIESNEINHASSLRRSLTLLDCLAIIVGIIIGSGIFSSPGIALARAGSPGAVILAWIISGCLVFVAAQCYMELGGMFPSAGGDYDYLGRAYGDAVAFSFAWFYFFISKTGSIAIISLVFGRYFSVALCFAFNLPLPIETNGINETFLSKASAVIITIIISVLNCKSVSESAYAQRIMTGLKMLLISLVFLLATVYVLGTDASTVTQNISPSHLFQDTSNISTFSSSLVACLWCFDGWADLNFMQEELINPKRDFVRTMVSGIGIVTIAYVLANMAYLSILPTHEIMTSSTIAIDVGRVLDESWNTGHFFALVFALGVALSAAGSLNGTIMTGGRIFYAVARGGSAPSAFASLNSAGAPWMAIVSQCIWSIILLLLPGSSFGVLLDYYGCMSWLYYALVSFAVVILRYRLPHIERPYKAWLYPLPPILVVFMASSIMISSLASEPLYTLFAISSVLIAFPVYYVFYQSNYSSNAQYVLTDNTNHSVHSP